MGSGDRGFREGRRTLLSEYGDMYFRFQGRMVSMDGGKEGGGELEMSVPLMKEMKF